MQSADIEQAIMLATYTAYFASERSVGLHSVREAIKADVELFEHVVADLQGRNLIQPRAIGWYFRITPDGILTAEDGIVPLNTVQTHQQARHRVLVYLSEAQEAEHHHYGRPYEQIATDLGLDLAVLRPNLMLLTDLRYIQAPSRGMFRISENGLQVVADWRRKTAMVQEFEDMAQLKPQPRGRAFQKLFGRQVATEGWEQEEGVRTANEEMDVILHRDGCYYIIECKWEKQPIGAPVVRELIGKLSKRSDVRGIVVSMSGFAETAKAEAFEQAAKATIVLFGPDDTRSIFEFRETFSSLLDQKLKEFLIRRKVVVK